MNDHLHAWGTLRDPLRSRHGLSRADYSSALTIFGKSRAKSSAAVMYFIAGLLIGLALGLLAK